MDTDSQEPLAIFEAKAIVTRERVKRTFVSTIIFIILIIIQTNTGALPTAIAGILLLATIFLALLFFASLMQFVFTRRSRIEIYPEKAIYYRGKKSTDYQWSELSDFKIEVLREAENVTSSAMPTAVRAYGSLFSWFVRTFVGDPPNYTLHLKYGDQKITMDEIVGDYQFLVEDLPDLIRPIWLEAIQQALASGQSKVFHELTLTSSGIQNKKKLAEWRNVTHSWEQDDDVRHYIFRDTTRKSGLLNTDIIITLPQHIGEVLISVIKQQTGEMAEQS